MMNGKAQKSVHRVSVVADGANGRGTEWGDFSLAPSATTDYSAKSSVNISRLYCCACISYRASVLLNTTV